MTQHPQTPRFRNLAQESEDGWAISELCDLLDAQHTQTEAALAELADAGMAPVPLIRLEVLPDPKKGRPDRAVIVCDHELPNLAGHLRSEREAHAGRWAYPFSRRESALGAAQSRVDENPGVYVLHTPTPNPTR